MIELVKKINAVMAEMGAVPKEGKNTFQNYAYLAHADLMKALHPLLIKHGLIIYPHRVRVESSEGETLTATSNNTTKTTRQNRVVIEVHYNITDGTDTIEFGGIGEGVDSQDKSAYKAQTGAHKYALKGLFCIPDELDAEDERFEQKALDPKENGQKPDAHSTQKCGPERALRIKKLMDAGYIKKEVIEASKKACNVKTVAELPKNEGEALENHGLDNKTKSEEGA